MHCVIISILYYNINQFFKICMIVITFLKNDDIYLTASPLFGLLAIFKCRSVLICSKLLNKIFNSYIIFLIY